MSGHVIRAKNWGKVLEARCTQRGCGWKFESGIWGWVRDRAEEHAHDTRGSVDVGGFFPTSAATAHPAATHGATT